MLFCYREEFMQRTPTNSSGLCQDYENLYGKYLNNNLINNYMCINIIIIIWTFNIKMLSHFLINTQLIPSIKIKDICWQCVWFNRQNIWNLVKHGTNYPMLYLVKTYYVTCVHNGIDNQLINTSLLCGALTLCTT